MGKLGDICFLNFFYNIYDSKSLFHLFNCPDKKLCCFMVRRIFVCKSCCNGKSVELFVNAGAIFPKYQRQQNGIGKSMGNVVLSAQGMSHCMNISYIGFGKSTACIEGGVEHISSCLNIIAMLIGNVYIFKNQFYRF